MAFKEAARKADPAILEPMMAVEVTTPEDYLGTVIGDLNARRGHVQSMDELHGNRVVRALVPLSEMFGYVSPVRPLRSAPRIPFAASRTSTKSNPPRTATGIFPLKKSAASFIIFPLIGESGPIIPDG